jgi:hypothetical protein
VTNLPEEEIFSFAWSPRGDLAVASSRLVSDVIVLTLKDADADGR